MRPLAPAAFAALLLCSTAPLAAAQTATEPEAQFRATTLSLSATGEVKAEPDMATITLGVQTTATTAGQAMAANARQMIQVVASLRSSGLEGKDIQTSQLNLQAQYDYEQNKPPRLAGYQASNQVTITVNDLARLGQALDAVVAAGANQINGVSFGLKDPKAAEDQARLHAVKALQAKAELYAGAAGYRVGRLVNLSEGSAITPEPRFGQVVVTGVRKGAATPVEAGELDVRVDVTGLYELAR